MHPYIIPLANDLKSSADRVRAVGVKSYMKNQFAFFGMPMSERRSICKHHMKNNTLQNFEELNAVVKELWILPEREYQYCGIEVIAYHKKLWTTSTIKLIEFCIVTKSWWDTVDFLAGECCGKYFQLFPQKIMVATGRWNQSSNMWLQRSSLLFQNKYKKQTDLQLLSSYIINLSSSKEFFIQKAIGWVLREYAKTDVNWVKEFVSNNTLAPLSKREAMKHLG